MVIFAKSEGSVYLGLNNTLQEELKKGIQQQQKAISSLSKTEKECKEKISRLDQAIKKQKLGEQKTQVGKSIQKYTEDLEHLRREITSSKNHSEHLQEVLSTLQKEIKAKREEKVKAGKNLEGKLHQLQVHQQKEAQRISAGQRQLQKESTSLQREKKEAQNKLNTTLAELQKRYLQEKQEKERQIAHNEIRFREWVKGRESLLGKEKSSLQAFQSKIAELNLEKEEINYNLEGIKKLSYHQVTDHKFFPRFLLRLSKRGEEELAKKEKFEILKARHSIQNLEKEIAHLHHKDKTLTQELEKKEHLLRLVEEFEQKYTQRKKVLNELNRELSELNRKTKEKGEVLTALLSKINLEKEDLSLKKKAKYANAKEIKKEILLLASRYEKNLSKIQSANEQLKSRIITLQEKRKQLWAGIERDHNHLNQTKSQIESIDQRIAERKRIDLNKSELLAEEIKKVEKGVFDREQKISRIHQMLYRVKGVSSDLPAVVSGFKKEESVVKQNLQALKKELLAKKEEAASVQEKSASYYSDFLLRKNHLGLIQKKMLLDKQLHEKNLEEINLSLNAIKVQIEHNSQKEAKLQDQEHQEIVQKEAHLTKEISEAGQAIRTLKKGWAEEVNNKKALVNDLHRLNEKKITLTEQVEKNNVLLREVSQKLEGHKKEYSELLEEELYRQRLLKKIKKDNLLEKGYFQQLLQELEHEAQQELINLNRRLELEGSSSEEFKHKMEQGKKDLSSLLVHKKRELLVEKKKIEVQISHNKRVKESIVLHQGKERMAELDKEIEQNIHSTESTAQKLESSRQDYEKELQVQRQKMLGEKSKLTAELKQLVAKDFSSKKHLADLREKIDGLNESVSGATARVAHAKQKADKIIDIFTQNSKVNQELNKVVHHKIKLIKEQFMLREELHQLNKVINGTGVSKKLKSKLKKLTPGHVHEKNEMASFLKKVDDLFGKLPKKEIDHFSKTSTFKQYQKIMKKYGVK